MKVCEQCGRRFKPRKHASRQKNCRRKSCRIRRRRLWQSERMEQDPDYRGNQELAAKQWREENSGYWQAYRKAHPTCAEKNRLQQAERNRRVRDPRSEVPDSILVPAPDGDGFRPSSLDPVIAKMGEVVRGIRELIRRSGQTPDIRTTSVIAKMGEPGALKASPIQMFPRNQRTLGGDCKQGRSSQTIPDD